MILLHKETSLVWEIDTMSSWDLVSGGFEQGQAKESHGEGKWVRVISSHQHRWEEHLQLERHQPVLSEELVPWQRRNPGAGFEYLHNLFEYLPSAICFSDAQSLRAEPELLKPFGEKEHPKQCPPRSCQ